MDVVIVFLGICVLEGTVILMAGNSFPGGIGGLMKFIMAKRLIWKIYPDGVMKPFSAKSSDISYKIDDKEYYDYTKKDVVTFARKPGILVYAPYNKGLEPESVSVLTLLKRYKIRNFGLYANILDAKVMSKEEYEKAVAQQNKYSKQVLRQEAEETDAEEGYE